MPKSVFLAPTDLAAARQATRLGYSMVSREQLRMDASGSGDFSAFDQMLLDEPYSAAAPAASMDDLAGMRADAPRRGLAEAPAEAAGVQEQQKGETAPEDQAEHTEEQSVLIGRPSEQRTLIELVAPDTPPRTTIPVTVLRSTTLEYPPVSSWTCAVGSSKSAPGGWLPYAPYQSQMEMEEEAGPSLHSYDAAHGGINPASGCWNFGRSSTPVQLPVLNTANTSEAQYKPVSCLTRQLRSHLPVL